MNEFIFLYGPPGAGKSSIGRPLAEALGVSFYDLDHSVEVCSGKSIPEIFKSEGEAGFRQRERQALIDTLQDEPGVVALGGGALTLPENRRLAEMNGRVLRLYADPQTLAARLSRASAKARPLLGGNLNARLESLLQRRAAHYASFPDSLDTSRLTPAEAAWQAQVILGRFRVRGMGAPYDVWVQEGGLQGLGDLMRGRSLQGPVALAADKNIAPLYAERVIQALAACGLESSLVEVQPGEKNKNMRAVMRLWQGFLQAGLERRSSVAALGGGVTGDLAGFAAATILRGVAWVNLPTSLLAMVDACLGGKTGFDLPQGKNLVGAFHPPAFVLCDPAVLSSLPAVEMRCGLAESIKTAVIGDPGLLELISGAAGGAPTLPAIVRRAIAVKVKVIEADPYEKGQRAALNFGHTIGHALEAVSNFRLRHGEAVAIGMLCEARLAERLGIAERGLAEQLDQVLRLAGLPTRVPARLERAKILAAMQFDKKRQGRKLRFALPRRLGEVTVGVEAEDKDILEVLG